MQTNHQHPLRFALGADHAGYRYKETVKEHLHNLGYETKDFGTFSNESVDYPDFIVPAAEAVAKSLVDYAIVFGGSGNGEAMAANKVKGLDVHYAGQLKPPNWPRSTTTQMLLQLANDKLAKI